MIRIRTIVAGAAAASVLALAACSSAQTSDASDTANIPVAASAGNVLEGQVEAASFDRMTAMNAREPLEANSAVLQVRGLSCPKCATGTSLALESVPGVLSSEIDMGAGEVRVTFGKHRPSPAQLAKAIEDAGFTFAGLRTP